MLHNRPRGRGSPPAFTLVELIVVMAIILAMATIVAATLPRTLENQKATRGANTLSGMLLVAKQRAVRDQVPTGVRLVVGYDPSNSNRQIVTEMLYITQPDDFVVTGDSMTITSAGSSATATSTTTDFSGGLYLTTSNTDAAEQYPVQPGDYFEASGGGLVALISAVQPGSGSIYNQLGLSNNPSIAAALGTVPSNSATVTSYRIIRQPRRVVGEDSVKLPDDVVVLLKDLPAFSGNPTVFWSQNFPERVVRYGNERYTFDDILFSPSGGVVGKSSVSSGDKIVLWVWDRTRDKETDGEPALVSVNMRTGFIATSPVDPSNPPNYYTFTQDPHNSGM